MAKAKNDLRNSAFGPIELYPAKIRLWAVINGGEYEVASAQLTFQMNSIPYGTLQLAVGINTDTLKPSPIHETLPNIIAFMSVSVYCEVTKAAGTDKYIPAGRFRIFEGYTAGRPGIVQDAAGTASVTLHVIHWLADLNRTSCVNASVAPDTPDNLFVGLGYGRNPAQGGAADTLPLTAVAGFSDDFVKQSFDVWAATKAVLVRMATEGAVIASIGGAVTTNSAAIRALNRFINKPNDLLLHESVQAFKGTIGASAGRLVFGEIGGQTAWMKLMMLAELLSFAVIPAVESAAAVPHVSVNSNVFKEISAKEISRPSIEPYQQRNLHGLVLIQYGTGDAQSFRINTPPPPTVVGSAGTVTDLENLPLGSIMYKIAPPWITTSLTPGGELCRASIGMDAKGGFATAMSPKPPLSVPAVKLTELRNMLSQSGNTMAQHYFNEERFKNRLGVLVGRLRFDIAPGSAVKVTGPNTDLPLLGANNEFLCNVTAVEHLLDAGSRLAVTTVVVNSVRSPLAPDEAGLPRHPMYENSWNGMPLIPETE